MYILHADLDERSYPIYIGENLLGGVRWLTLHIIGYQVAAISNETVAPFHLETLLKVLQGHKVASVVLPNGETYKQWETLQLIFDALLKEWHDRKTTLIASGGGVINDMTGFTAACCQCGASFIQIPTTLLSWVDSSVGGKTGINHPLDKNMIGAFYQPQTAAIDTAPLKMLPSRGLSAGLARVIKYGFICDELFIIRLEAYMDVLLALKPTVVTEAIERSYAAKARVMGINERESGVRATLNPGHTSDHAVGTQQGYGVWLHGEAVGAGTMMAFEMSHRLSWLNTAERGHGTRLLRQAGLPVVPPAEITAENFMGHMAVDKKVLDGRLRLVLLQGLGNTVVIGDFLREISDATLRADYRALADQLGDE